MLSIIYSILHAFSTIFSSIVRLFKFTNDKQNLPPGPNGLPFLGSALDTWKALGRHLAWDLGQCAVEMEATVWTRVQILRWRKYGGGFGRVENDTRGLGETGRNLFRPSTV